jgi:hypothetical protein
MSHSQSHGEQSAEIAGADVEFEPVEAVGMKQADPGTERAIEFDEISRGDDQTLMEWCETRAGQVAERYDIFTLDMSLVHWGTFDRSGQRAGTLYSIRPDEATVGTPIDWDKTRQQKLGVTEYDPVPETDRVDDVKESRIFVSWAAAATYSATELEGILKHELIHAEQHQRYGATNHGAEFQRMLEKCDDLMAGPPLETG